ncbi:hypothetical protein BGX28_003832 [Mortierella sp. GBA30]|nr:hypothetical protein BGX28_003832 [Mortierella sp. GBA30]
MAVMLPLWPRRTMFQSRILAPIAQIVPSDRSGLIMMSLLNRALETSGPLNLKDDLADRINKIVINDSKYGVFSEARTKGFRGFAFNKVYQPQALTSSPSDGSSKTCP